MTDIVKIRPGDTVTILPKSTDVRRDTYTVEVRNTVLPNRYSDGGVWDTTGTFFPAARVRVEETVDALMARAAAKSEAHAGLAAALEYGTVRVLRVDGIDRVTATYDGSTYVVTVYPSTGMAACNGYGVNSTCRDLAHAAIRTYRNR